MSFVTLTAILIFSTEPLLNKFSAGIHDVKMWLNIVTYGVIGLFILTIISCLIFLGNKKKKQRIKKIELTENGFLINCDGEVTRYKWSEIEKLTGFKMDRLTVDDICLKIEANEKESFTSEEFDGWRIFMNKMLNEFPQIDKNWEETITKPAFERNETVLYYQNKNVE